MSTFYYLVCKKCEKKQEFVGRMFPGRIKWLPGNKSDILKFIEKHYESICDLQIVPEYDPKSDWDDEAYSSEQEGVKWLTP